MRLDPAGMIDDADIRIAQSVMDYLTCRLALDYLPLGEGRRARHLLGRGARGRSHGSYSGSSDSTS